MKTFIWAPVALSLAMVVGCGGGDSKPAKAPETTTPATSTGAGSPPAEANKSTGNVIKPTDPKEVVRVFFDAMRAGNGDQIAELFSSKARLEIEKQGWKIEPLGSSQATFDVQEATLKGDVYIVSSKWVEPPTVEGEEPMVMEVLWGLRQEINGWRICEMAVDPGTGEEYEVVNFENLDVENQTPANQQPEQPASRVASLPGATPTTNAFPEATAAPSSVNAGQFNLPAATNGLPPAATSLPPSLPSGAPSASGFPSLPPATQPN